MNKSFLSSLNKSFYNIKLDDMKVLRTVKNIELNEGNLMAKGLFNVSMDKKVSFWFDSEEKDHLMSLTDEQFFNQTNELINEAESIECGY